MLPLLPFTCLAGSPGLYSDIEHIWQLSYRGGFYRGGPVLMSALSGIDIALWDLKGKQLLGSPLPLRVIWLLTAHL